MSVYLLDTNVIIGVMNDRAPTVARRLATEIRLGNVILLSSVVIYELRYGIARSDRRATSEAALSRFLEGPVTPIPFDPDDAANAGEIRAELAKKGTPIGPYDVLIAAQARRRGATLVSANTREFQRVAGLLQENWATGNM